jgi:general secretion pathway protein A
MSYYRALGLAEEPFSNSPSPDYFYRVPGRVECLNMLEVSVRLRRGLSVVLGDVGAGKTTLCRQLIRNLADDDGFVACLMLDPYFESPLEFLRALHTLLYKHEAEDDLTEWQLKEQLKQALLKLGVYKKSPVLIIDEGQKIQDHCLELLRELLNFETNENKLLQIVIFAQSEFRASIEKYPNLMDRIDTLHTLKPLTFMETREMIRFRLEQAKADKEPPHLFSTGAYWTIFRFTRGFPRKIVSLSHKVLLEVLMKQHARADWKTVYRAAGRSLLPLRLLGAGAVCALFLGLWFHTPLPTMLHKAQDTPLLPDTASAPATVGDASEITESTPDAMAGDPEALAVEASGSAVASAAPGDALDSLELRPASTVHPGVFSAVPELDKPASASRSNIEAQRSVLYVDGEPAPGSDRVSPEVLGSLRMQKNVPLSVAISRVFGTFKPRYLERIMALNPGIDNADAVAVGDEIGIPALEPMALDATAKGYWLVFATHRTLEEAYAALGEPPFSSFSLRLLPVYAPGDRLRFHVVDRTPYPHEQAALNALTNYPEPMQTGVLIMRHWDPEYVCYGDASSLAQVARR